MNAITPVRQRKVMIGTPTKSGDTCIYYTLALAHSMYQAALRGIDLYPIFIPHDSFIQHARNRLMKQMLEDGCDDLIFADADNDWDPQWVFDLLAHPVDCVGGTYPRKQEAEHYEIRSIANPVKRCAKTGLLIVDGLGAGFLRLSRRAVQALWDTSQPYIFTGEQHRMMTDVRVVNGGLTGEDTIIVMSLAKLGIPSYLDDRMTCGHTGTKHWKGDIRPWLKRLEAPARSAAGPDRNKVLP